MMVLSRQEFITAIAPAILAGVIAVVAPPAPVVGVLAILAFLTLVMRWPMLGWLLVVLTYPFIYLQFFLGRTINIPYVDALAILTLAAVIIRTIATSDWKSQISNLKSQIRFPPGLLPFLLFLAAAALSLTNTDDVALGVKFLFRPLAFFYLMYVVLPWVLIDRPEHLFRTFRALFVVGCIAAAMGIWSLVFPPEPGAFRRAVPIVIHGMTPLGTNHNLIAEVLVSVIPIGFVLAARARGLRRRWYVVGTALLALVTLLTFSRNGWITLAIESVIVMTAIARARRVSWRRILRWAVPIVATAAVVVGVFSTTSIARSSNRNRIQLTQIAIAEFREHPWVGAGVGTFIEAVSRDRWYIADFGKPQEAHGLVQKLLAETGTFGLLMFAALLGTILARIIRVLRHPNTDAAWHPILLALLCSAAGSIVFQLFNTSYFVSKLWLPLGIALAAAHLAERGIALHREDASRAEVPAGQC